MKGIYLLALIFILGTVLRYWLLGDVPVSLHRDEAFLGYNAFSLLKTGRDMSGALLPLHFESFIYSPGGYSYFSIPFTAVFGLSEFSVRFASFIFGSLSILLIYLVCKQLFNKEKLSNTISLFAALLLAISPWHINLSRTATENAVVVFFILLGTYLFMKWLRLENKVYLFSAFASFAVTLTLYQAPRVFLPLFIPLFIILFINKKQFFKNKFILTGLYLFVIILPLIFILTSQNLSTRIRSLSILNHEYTNLTVQEQIANDGVAGVPYLVTRLFHNRWVTYSHVFLNNYFAHFSYPHLFSDEGFPERYKVPHAGILHLYILPFFIMGSIYFILKRDKRYIFLIAWILISPIGSALASDDIPNLQRTLFMLPPILIISAYGLIKVFTFVKLKKKLFYPSVSFVFLIIFLSLVYYLLQYYSQAPAYRPWLRQDGYRELVSYTNSIKGDYKKIVITNRESAPTIFFLFYEKYDPSLFQKETKKSKLRDFDRVNFNGYEFTEQECPVKMELDPNSNTEVLIGERGTLYINSGLCDIPEGAILLKTIKRADNSEVFHVLTVK